MNAVVVIDSECPMCSRFAHWVIARDGAGRFRFISRQSDEWRTSGKASDPRAHETVVLVEGAQAYFRSTAVLRVLAGCGGAWRVVAAAALLIPRPLRDGVYDLVARHRHFLK